jgi:GNAT superfamily N-acetyltransferase
MAGTERLRSKAREYAHRERTWIWWELDLAGDRPRPPLAEGHELVRIDGPEQLQPFLALPPEERDVVGSDPLERMQAGGVPWLVVADGRTAFTCWTFLHRAPMDVMPSQWLELPDQVALLEDSITAKDFRGQGIAPRTWAAVADRLLEDGYRFLVTRVGDDNDASNRAVAKAGFQEIGRMTFRQNGPRHRLRMHPTDGGGGTGGALAQLVHQDSWQVPSTVKRLVGGRGRAAARPAAR